MTALSLSQIEHAYLGRAVLSDIDLSIAPGEIVALVGPSSCGKSTLAHIAAGLLDAKAGRITRGYQRHAMIFQEPRLMFWATAVQNIGYPLRIAGIRRVERAERVAEAAESVALEAADLGKYPVELSGGMRQRVTIARALVTQPDFNFFDEPFTELKRRMQDLVIGLCAGGSMAGLFITHDLNEAARLADRIAALDRFGNGIAGTRSPPEAVGARSDARLFDWVQGALQSVPIFRHIHDVDERRIA